jgi:nicotinamide mononucleotide transporter
MLNNLSWIIVAASIIGAIYNARAKILGFYIWVVANVAWVVYDLYIGSYSQAALFVVYTIISIIGIIQWRKKRIK